MLDLCPFDAELPGPLLQLPFAFLKVLSRGLQLTHPTGLAWDHLIRII